MQTDDHILAFKCLEETPLQKAARLNNLRSCIDLLLRNADPNEVGASKITPLLWAASHSNKTLASVIILFGAKINTTRKDYPELFTHFSKQTLADLPELKSITTVCPVKLMTLVNPKLTTLLLPVAIRHQRLCLNPWSSPKTRLRMYISKTRHSMISRCARRSIMTLLLCLQYKTINTDPVPYILNFIHAYSFDRKN